MRYWKLFAMVLLLVAGMGTASALISHHSRIQGSILASALHAMGVGADPALQARIVDLSKQIEDLQRMVTALIPEQQEKLDALQREQQEQQRREDEAREALRVEEERRRAEEERRRAEEEARRAEEERVREEEKAKEMELIRELEMQKKKLESELRQQAEEARKKVEEERLAEEKERLKKEEVAAELVEEDEDQEGVCGEEGEGCGFITSFEISSSSPPSPQSGVLQESIQELSEVVRGLQADSQRISGDMRSWELYKAKEIRSASRKSKNAAKILKEAKDSEQLARDEKVVTAAISEELLSRLDRLQAENEELRERFEGLAAELERKLSALDTEVDELTKRVDEDDAEEEAVRSSGDGASGTTTDMAEIQDLIDQSLGRFAADRVGMPDYALESSGGIVFTIGETEPYTKDTPWMGVFGISIWKSCKTPRLAIQADNSPGNCWSFFGDHGTLTVQLSAQVFPEYFTLDHIPLELAPGKNASSAPKHFRVLGLDYGNAPKGHVLGNYEFTQFPIETFAVQQNPYEKYFRFIKIEVLSNYGNKDYTCLYRFRVHGKPYDIDTYNG